MKKLISVFLLGSFLSACASYSGRGLQVGQDGLAEIEHAMGSPAMRWRNADGSAQLAYPRGPSGMQTFMVMVDANGKLRSIVNVLEVRTLSQVRPGMTRDEVYRLIGPPEPTRTIAFPARNELALDWYFQDIAGPAHFIVLLDASTNVVRSTAIQDEVIDPL